MNENDVVTVDSSMDTTISMLVRNFVNYLFLACAAVMPAHGMSLILHYQGEVDDREIFFADVRSILNRTPSDQISGPSEIRELGVTAVYESTNKPELVHLRLQFECPNEYVFDTQMGTIKGNDRKKLQSKILRFRIGPQSYKIRRSDLESEPVRISDWQPVSSPFLEKASKVACNHIDLDRALHSSIKGLDFDFDGFSKQLQKLELPPDLMLIGQVLPSEVLDYAWKQIWWEKYFAGDRPNPSGKWTRYLTPADKETARKKLEEAVNTQATELAAARQSLLEGIKKSQDQFSSRGSDRKLTPIESNLLTLWRGRPENQVVAAMGNPEFNSAGETHFLRYTKYWEKPTTVAYGSQGIASSEIGGYAECFVEFKTKQLNGKDWVVDDILVRSNYSDAGLGRTRELCNDVARKAAQ